MTTLDFSPLFRSMIGFDRLANSLETAYRTEPGGYPPYNVEVMDENSYRITLAVAGFTESELDIEAKENLLTVTGQRKTAEAEGNFLYRGIANRGFERKFQLADYVRVAEARLENGLLNIELVREVPEAMKPRRIEIRGTDGGPSITHESGSEETAKAA
ncbi:Hsp20 family protein [Imhoffiella purpurea]|uniref:16 kDa heat shock protein A n=1 Tax=Imhoffiella purpurea TaxID=1249627 RepID=W9VH90_9GAMM|nr:Hsp20 family protein [Imhoffiella purpurea]EXJ16366.1 16 kDa heat shock protein A [Imhoffiella purpurea]